MNSRFTLAMRSFSGARPSTQRRLTAVSRSPMRSFSVARQRRKARVEDSTATSRDLAGLLHFAFYILHLMLALYYEPRNSHFTPRRKARKED
jgi:hypothetical protein